MKKYISAYLFALVLPFYASANVVISDDFPFENSATVYSAPVALVLNFNADFPLAKNEVWKNENGKVFVEFTSNDQKSYAVYDKHGKLVVSYVGMNVNDLPVISKSHLNSKFPNKKIKNAYMITDADGNQKILVELKNADNVIYAAEGYFLRYQ